jgi:hypothetical protein
MSTASPRDPAVVMPKQHRALVEEGHRAFEAQHGAAPAPQEGDGGQQQQDRQPEPPRQEPEPPRQEPEPRPEPPPRQEPEPPSDEQLGVNSRGERVGDRPAPDGWEHRYRSLQGKYDAETARFRQQIAQLQGAVDALSRQRGQATEPEPPRKEKRKLVTPEDETFLGKDVLEVVQRQARELYEDEIADLRRTIDDMRGQLQGTAQQVQNTTRLSLVEVLDRNLPGWKDQNNDAAFIAWLHGEDEMTGVVRQDILRKAQQDGNAQRIITVFQAYRRDTGAQYGSQQGNQPRETGGQQPLPRKATVPIESLIAPARSRANTSAPAPDGQRQFSQGEIDAYWKERQTYMRQGRPIPKDLLDKERDIHAAVVKLSGAA